MPRFYFVAGVRLNFVAHFMRLILFMTDFIALDITCGRYTVLDTFMADFVCIMLN